MITRREFLRSPLLFVGLPSDKRGKDFKVLSADKLKDRFFVTSYQNVYYFIQRSDRSPWLCRRILTSKAGLPFLELRPVEEYEEFLVQAENRLSGAEISYSELVSDFGPYNALVWMTG